MVCHLDFISQWWLYVPLPRCCMPQMLTCAYKRQGKQFSDLLYPFSTGGKDFLLQVVMVRWTWFQDFGPKSDQRLKWHSTSCSSKENFRCVPSAGKVMITVLWDEKGVPVVHAFRKGMTAHCLCCNETTGSLNACLCPLSVSQNKNVRSVGPLWHTRLRTSVHTTEVITYLGSVATPVQYYRPHTIRFSPVWSFSVQKATSLFHEWQSTASLVWWPDYVVNDWGIVQLHSVKTQSSVQSLLQAVARAWSWLLTI